MRGFCLFLGWWVPRCPRLWVPASAGAMQDREHQHNVVELLPGAWDLFVSGFGLGRGGCEKGRAARDVVRAGAGLVLPPLLPFHPGLSPMTRILCCQMEGGERGRERSESEASRILPAASLLRGMISETGRALPGQICRCWRPSLRLAAWHFPVPPSPECRRKVPALFSLQEKQPQTPPQPQEAPLPPG